jgi:hypothetical protein
MHPGERQHPGLRGDGGGDATDDLGGGRRARALVQDDLLDAGAGAQGRQPQGLVGDVIVVDAGQDLVAVFQAQAAVDDADA